MVPGELEVIPDELSRELAPSAGSRNILVHEYDTLDDGLILEAVGKARRLYREYIKAIGEYMKRRERMWKLL